MKNRPMCQTSHLNNNEIGQVCHSIITVLDALCTRLLHPEGSSAESSLHRVSRTVTVTVIYALAQDDT